MIHFNMRTKNLLFICISLLICSLSFAQEQDLCLEEIEEYSVEEHTGSTYEWEVEEASFEGNINETSTSGNAIEINWGQRLQELTF
ncbi:MAG: hypothetical protein ACQESK_02710 [Bacteroidota bacterium]